jgi:hypothetical protein
MELKRPIGVVTSGPPLAPAPDALYIALMFASESYRNCLETERLLMKDIRNAEISARDRAVCANALDRVLERKRILRMKPAPKAVDANKYEEQRRKQRKFHPQEIIEAPCGPHGIKPPAELTQPPSVAVKYEMQDMPGFPGAKVMVVKKPPAREREAAQTESSIKIVRPFAD